MDSSGDESGQEEDEPRPVENNVDVGFDRMSVDLYLTRLAEEGTLEPKHVTQYLSWGHRTVCVGADVVTLRFLRGMHGGTGCSKRQGQEMLSFLHSLGGPASVLPKDIRSCWDMINKVQHQHSLCKG